MLAVLDNWSPMPLVDWEQGRYLEQIVHVRTYLEQLVLSASSPVAARAARTGV